MVHEQFKVAAMVACGQCRLVRSEAEWSTLRILTEVAGAELASLVSRWPDHVVVVVRACTCGAPIARLALRKARTPKPA